MCPLVSPCWLLRVLPFQWSDRHLDYVHAVFKPVSQNVVILSYPSRLVVLKPRARQFQIYCLILAFVGALVICPGMLNSFFPFAPFPAILQHALQNPLQLPSQRLIPQFCLGQRLVRWMILYHIQISKVVTRSTGLLENSFCLNQFLDQIFQNSTNHQNRKWNEWKTNSSRKGHFIIFWQKEIK